MGRSKETSDLGIEVYPFISEEDGRAPLVKVELESITSGLSFETELKVADAVRLHAELGKALETARKVEEGKDKVPEGHVIDLQWGCESDDSPTGFCAYNTEEDPCMDNCIYCGNPVERK